MQRKCRSYQQLKQKQSAKLESHGVLLKWKKNRVGVERRENITQISSRVVFLMNKNQAINHGVRSKSTLQLTGREGTIENKVRLYFPLTLRHMSAVHVQCIYIPFYWQGLSCASVFNRSMKPLTCKPLEIVFNIF